MHRTLCFAILSTGFKQSAVTVHNRIGKTIFREVFIRKESFYYIPEYRRTSFFGYKSRLFSVTTNASKSTSCSIKTQSKQSNMKTENSIQRVPVKRGEELELRIEGLVAGGDGISRIGRYVVMVPHSVPGQLVKVVVSRVRSSYANAKVIQVVEQSPYRVEPLCKHFGPFGCGGCKFQDILYDKQLEEKFHQIIRHYEGLVSRLNYDVKDIMKPIVPSPDIFGYRNKMVSQYICVAKSITTL